MNDSEPTILAPDEDQPARTLSSIRRQADEPIRQFGPIQSSNDASHSIQSNEGRRLGVTETTHAPLLLSSSRLERGSDDFPLLQVIVHKAHTEYM